MNCAIQWHLELPKISRFFIYSNIYSGITKFPQTKWVYPTHPDDKIFHYPFFEANWKPATVRPKCPTLPLFCLSLNISSLTKFNCCKISHNKLSNQNTRRRKKKRRKKIASRGFLAAAAMKDELFHVLLLNTTIFNKITFMWKCMGKVVCLRRSSNLTWILFAFYNRLRNILPR